MAFLLRLTGDGVDGMVVAGEELEILGTGELEGGDVSGGGWMSTALPVMLAPGMMIGVGIALYCTGVCTAVNCTGVCTVLYCTGVCTALYCTGGIRKLAGGGPVHWRPGINIGWNRPGCAAVSGAMFGCSPD